MLIIKGGRIIDPGRLDGVFDVKIDGGRIVAVDPSGGKAFADDGLRETGVEAIDATGLIVTPGLIDMHVHLREPGHEYKETIASGVRAAAAGGFTSVCCMANTNPVNDNLEITSFILHKAREAGMAKVYPVAAVSRGLRGDALTEFGALKHAGVVALSDDGRPVVNSELMRRALEYAAGFGLPVISHCEDLDLVAGGVMNEGAAAARLGLAGIPNTAESVMVMRDIALCEWTGAALHIAHVSTRESVRALREAKKRGLPVTAETAPHYFTLTDEALSSYDTNARMNPPLRGPADRDAVREGLADGVIDVIASDHAPHSALEKDVEFDRAANGIIGLETSLSLGLRLVREGVLSLTELIARMTTRPAKIVNISSGIYPGAPADITLIDLDAQYTVDASRFRSISRNTPFNGWEMTGQAVMTIVDGRIVYNSKNENKADDQ